MKSFLLSAAALIATAVAHPQDLEARAQPIVGLLDVYALAECASTGVDLSGKEYQLPNHTCVNTLPGSENSMYLSYRAGVQGGVPAGDRCYFNIYAGLGCQGNYFGFMSSDANNRTCQETSLGTTDSGATVGGKSAELFCYSP